MARILRSRSPSAEQAPGPSVDGRSQLLRREEVEVTGAPWRRQGKAQHSPGQVGEPRKGNGRGLLRVTRTPGLTHCQESDPLSLARPAGLVLGIRDRILPFPVEVVVEGRGETRHAGGEIPQIHALPQGALLMYRSLPRPHHRVGTEISRRAVQGLRRCGGPCLQHDAPITTPCPCPHGQRVLMIVKTA